MQVLLLGGHGKVALHLTPLLLKRAWNVTSVVRNPDHEKEILELGKGLKGKINVLISSLDDIKSANDAQKVLDATTPDYVVWAAGTLLPPSLPAISPPLPPLDPKPSLPSPVTNTYETIAHPHTNNVGAGGKGGAARTVAIDQEAAKHFITASFATPSVSKFLLISWLGSRRVQPSWIDDEGWKKILATKNEILPAYAAAKLVADEYQTALAAKRKRDPATADKPFQSISLRPGTLTDEPATRKVGLGKQGPGKVTREDVAIVADQLLARADTEGWYDLINGDLEVEKAVEKAATEKLDAVEFEDVDAMIKEFFP
ncbi:hypothetical protein N7468_005513 [Penicillium chermesinum]|uniref:NAD(P)-binding domain-containing protein n=1 Tax=Penicillium chermesinum TaxID=63820 RepID=A0A9W9P1S4_9EURO|nr:uncharacterized protein N7468_005513 [Penicillium chermesinum]KAJ5232557.1 hypothetical protein N7468_005513 [Penicillium chermesinum]